MLDFENKEKDSNQSNELKKFRKSVFNLGKGDFSKIIVIYGLTFVSIAIIFSFYLLVCKGIDASPILSICSAFIGTELVVLGAKRIAAKEEKAEDYLFNKIEKEDEIIRNVMTEDNTENDTQNNNIDNENGEIGEDEDDFGSINQDGRG